MSSIEGPKYVNLSGDGSFLINSSAYLEKGHRRLEGEQLNAINEALATLSIKKPTQTVRITKVEKRLVVDVKYTNGESECRLLMPETQQKLEAVMKKRATVSSEVEGDVEFFPVIPELELDLSESDSSESESLDGEFFSAEVSEDGDIPPLEWGVDIGDVTSRLVETDFGIKDTALVTSSMSMAHGKEKYSRDNIRDEKGQETLAFHHYVVEGLGYYQHVAAQNLLPPHVQYRGVKGDGHCLFRSVGAALLLNLEQLRAENPGQARQIAGEIRDRLIDMQLEGYLLGEEAERDMRALVKMINSVSYGAQKADDIIQDDRLSETLQRAMRRIAYARNNRVPASDIAATKNFGDEDDIKSLTTELGISISVFRPALAALLQEHAQRRKIEAENRELGIETLQLPKGLPHVEVDYKSSVDRFNPDQNIKLYIVEGHEHFEFLTPDLRSERRKKWDTTVTVAKAVGKVPLKMAMAAASYAADSTAIAILSSSMTGGWG